MACNNIQTVNPTTEVNKGHLHAIPVRNRKTVGHLLGRLMLTASNASVKASMKFVPPCGMTSSINVLAARTFSVVVGRGIVAKAACIPEIPGVARTSLPPKQGMGRTSLPKGIMVKKSWGASVLQ